MIITTINKPKRNRLQCLSFLVSFMNFWRQ